jgi:hypothetical protein
MISAARGGRVYLPESAGRVARRMWLGHHRGGIQKGICKKQNMEFIGTALRLNVDFPQRHRLMTTETPPVSIWMTEASKGIL